MLTEVKFEVDIPDGYEFVRFDFVNYNEEYIEIVSKKEAEISRWLDSYTSKWKYMIVRKSTVPFIDIPYGEKFKYKNTVYVKVAVKGLYKKNGGYAVEEKSFFNDHIVHPFSFRTQVERISE